MIIDFYIQFIVAKGTNLFPMPLCECNLHIYFQHHLLQLYFPTRENAFYCFFYVV